MGRARRGAKPVLGEKVSAARVRYNGAGPMKVRQVVDLIRGLSVEEAEIRLATVHRPSSVPMLKRLLKSAFSNANQKGAEGRSFKSDELVIGTIQVDSGPIAWRFHPRAMGRSNPIRKRTSHITMELYTEA